MSGIWLGASVLSGAAVGLPAVVVALVLGANFWFFRQWSALLWVGVVVCATLGAVRVGAEQSPSVDWIDDVDAVRGVVASAPTVRGRSQSFVLSVQEVRQEGKWGDVQAKLYVTAQPVPKLATADRVSFSGDVEPVDDLPEGIREYFALLGVSGTAYAPRVDAEQVGTGWQRTINQLAASIGHRLQAAAPGDRGALLSGLVTGNDAGLTPERRERFIATSTSHITAVSGSNFALLVVIAVWIGRNTGSRRRLVWQAGTTMLVWAYAVLVGLDPPAMRAATVATAALFASRFGRRPDFVTLIILSAGLEVLIRPEDIGFLSFQLSVASSLALALVLSGLRPSGPLNWFLAATVASVAADLATLPILMPAFDRISLVGVPANLLIGPVTSFSFVLAVVASAVFPFSSVGGEGVAAVAGLGAQYVLTVVDALGGDGDALIATGEMGPLGWIALSTTCIVGIIAMSADCRRSTLRFWRAATKQSNALRLAACGGLFGACLGTAFAWTFF